MDNGLRGRGGRRTAWRLLLAALAALAGLALTAGPASAHAALLHSDPSPGQVLPTAPPRATFTFDESIRSVPGAVHLFAADGTELGVRAATTDRVLVVDLPTSAVHGSYTIVWRIVSADGHPVSGSVSYAVGAPSARTVIPVGTSTGATRAVVVAIATVQALVYLGLFLVVGLLVFLAWLLPRAHGLEDIKARLARIARAGAGVTIAASVLLLPLTTTNQRGDGLSALVTDPAVWRPDFSGPEPGAALLLIVAVSASLIALSRGFLRLGAGAGLFALASLALVGHTRSHGPFLLVAPADLVHVTTGAVWLGGLVGLTVGLRRLTDRPTIAAAALSRFSTVAATLLGALIVTGSIQAFEILGSWNALFTTPFGKALLVKIVVVIVVIVIAGANRYRLLPSVLRESGQEGRVRAIRAIRSAVRLEALLLVAVLGITGLLVDRSPTEAHSGAAAGRTQALSGDGLHGSPMDMSMNMNMDMGTSAAAGPDASGTGQAPGFKVRVTASPGVVGSNAIDLIVTDEGGVPLKPYDLPTLSLSLGSLDLGDVPLHLTGRGEYGAMVTLPRSGTWTAQVAVRTSEFDSRVIAIAFRIS